MAKAPQNTPEAEVVKAEAETEAKPTGIVKFKSGTVYVPAGVKY